MAIYVNQVGYYPWGVKKATVAHATSYSLYKENGEKVLSGEVTTTFDKLAGDESATIDFSNITDEGIYYFKDSTGVESCKFSISKDIYNTLTADSLKMFYYQRCGMELTKEYAGEFTHKACHTENVTLLSDSSVSFECNGGWHDAGDYGRYTTPGAVTIAQLLYGYELCKDVATNLSVNIPESGNGIPDILNECKYELDWLLKMQAPNGAVYHKCTSMRHASFCMPEEDLLPYVVTPISSLATADYAAALALSSRIFEEYDKDYAEVLKASAIRAGEWLLENPHIVFKNPDEVKTGQYTDVCDTDERLWAHAELYRLTGNKKHLEKIRDILFTKTALTPMGWADVGGLAAIAVLTAKEGTFIDDIACKFRNAIIDEANRLKSVVAANNYGLSLYDYEFIWGSNMLVLTNAMLLCLAHKLTGDMEHLSLAQNQVDYILGRNPMDTSYVTGYGEKAYSAPHHRPMEADNIEKAIPGFVSGGPNKDLADLTVRSFVQPGTAPMKCYIDHWKSPSTNEIAIYWNSPLVFVLLYLQSINETV